jgi:lipid-binding SYLF domain-containing protein
MRVIHLAFLTGIVGVLTVVAADDTTGRVERSIAVLKSINGAKNGHWAEQIAAADCVAVIPGFKKGAAVVGFGYGRGFLSCRRGEGWSAPGAVTLETSSLGVQVGGEAIDIVVLFLDAGLRQKLLSGRFAVGTDASAAWGNGKAAHEDPNAKVVFFGRTKGMFAGFGLDGASLSVDDSSNKSLYGKSITNREVVEGGTEAPAAAQPLATTLSSVTNR